MPGPMIFVDGLVWFDGVGDVMLTAQGLAAATDKPEQLLNALRIAAEYRDNEHLRRAAQGQGLLADAGNLSFEEFIVALEDIISSGLQTDGARRAKVAALRVRRSEFSANRAALILKMLAAGALYRCVHPGCAVVENLTVDHRDPVSRGGTDDITNLQFMCLPHNAAKGNRI